MRSPRSWSYVGVWLTPRHLRRTPTRTASTPCAQLVKTVHRWWRCCGHTVEQTRTTQNPSNRPTTFSSDNPHPRHHDPGSRFALQPCGPKGSIPSSNIFHQRLVVTAATTRNSRQPPPARTHQKRLFWTKEVSLHDQRCPGVATTSTSTGRAHGTGTTAEQGRNLLPYPGDE